MTHGFQVCVFSGLEIEAHTITRYAIRPVGSQIIMITGSSSSSYDPFHQFEYLINHLVLTNFYKNRLWKAAGHHT